MNKIIILSSVLVAVIAGWILHAWQVGPPRADEARLRLETGARISSGKSGATKRPARPPESGRVPESDSQRPAGRPAESREESVRTGIDARGTAADQLKAQRLAEQWGLAGARLGRLMPMLTDHAAQERRSTEVLLAEAEFGIFSTDAEFLETLLQRARTGTADSPLRGELNGDELEALDEFNTVQDRNALNLLANREYEVWEQHIEFGDSEQAVFEVFYDQWKERLQIARDRNLTRAGLDAELSAQGGRTIEKLSTILPAEDIEVMRIARDGSNDPALRNFNDPD